MLNCKDMTTEAQSFVDGELSLWKRMQVRFHLFICKYCRRYLLQLKLTIAALQQSDLLEDDSLIPTESEIDDLVARLKQNDNK
ncbi:MAG: hypothetical protein ACI82A_002314 [Candidatus Azotimanducaceae bacterium]|jgi:hypothetical protein